MKFDEKLIKRQKNNLILLGAALLILTAGFCLKEYRNNSYIMGKKNEITGIVRSKGDQYIPLCLKAVQEGKEKKQEIVLRFSERKGVKPSKKEDDTGRKLDRQIRQAIKEIEENEGKKIPLPEKGKEGAEFSWSRKKNIKPLLLPLFYPVLAYVLYRWEKEKENKKRKKFIRDIKRELPQFNNQLLLLLNSGLVFSDAFEKIAAGYRRAGAENNPLKKLVVEISDESKTGERSLITVFTLRSQKLGIRELSRLASIIVNHQHRGSDLREKLQAESEILWSGRKKDAEVHGRIGETKLSFPLAILLVVLIMITAAPAVLEI